MNKKGMTLGFIVTSLVILALLVIVLAVFFIGPDAILGNLADGANSLADSVLSGIGIGGNNEKSSFQNIDSIGEEYENFLALFRKAGKGPCILDYGPFSEEFYEFKLTLLPVDQETFVQLYDSNNQAVKSNTVSGIKPCVITPAKNFYENYLDGTSCDLNCKQDHNVVGIEITGPYSITIDDKKADFEDGNILFKARDGNVCFIPTRDGGFSCSDKGEFLDDDCIAKIKNSLPKC